METQPLDAAGRDAALVKLADELARNALFQVSTTGMEQFHVDFLYWLARTAPQESAHVWHTFAGECFEELPEHPHRERGRVDLDLGFPSGRRVVVETSLHPGTDTAPLVALWEGLELPEGPAPTPHLALLSLFAPEERLPAPWTHVPFDDLLHPLGVAVVALRAHGLQDDAVVVDLYIRALRGLIRLRGLTDPAVRPALPIKLGSAAEKALREIRLLSLVRRAQGASLAAMIRERVGAGIDETDHFGSDMAGATAAIQHLVRIREGEDRGRALGWQLQNHRFRLVAVARPEHDGLPAGPVRSADGTKPAKGTRSPLGEHFPEWFDFSPYESESLALARSSSRTWHKSGDDLAYQYRTLPSDTTPEQFVGLAVEASHRALDQVERLESR